MIRRPPRSTLSASSAASDVYKRQPFFQHVLSFFSFFITKLLVEKNKILLHALNAWSKIMPERSWEREGILMSFCYMWYNFSVHNEIVINQQGTFKGCGLYFTSIKVLYILCEFVLQCFQKKLWLLFLKSWLLFLFRSLKRDNKLCMFPFVICSFSPLCCVEWYCGCSNYGPLFRRPRLSKFSEALRRSEYIALHASHTCSSSYFIFT